MVASRAEARERRDSVATSGRLPFPVVLFAALPPVLALLLAACSGGRGAASAANSSATPAVPADGVLTVRAFEWGFEPEAIALRRGEQVRIDLQNEGATLHDLKVEELAADIIESRSTGPLSGGDDQLFVGADAGQRGTLVFVPQESGTFTFYCTIQGHRELGMEGTLTVK